MNTQLIEEFFYSRASKRIAERVKSSGLKYAEIYKPDHKQISRIVNNERNKNNRFLICDAVISNYYIDDESGRNIECGLLATKKLHFNSITEILWGTDSEIGQYLYPLFETLWNEYAVDNLGSDLYLCDYVPYAKNSTYYNLLFNSGNTFPAIFYGIREDTIIEELEPSKESALLFLYQKCKKDFSEYFLLFVKEHQSFHKLDKVISNALFPSFVSILENHKPDASSLGLRVRDLINADLYNTAAMVATGDYDLYKASLNRASSNYILSLEAIQSEYFIKKRNGTD